MTCNDIIVDMIREMVESLREDYSVLKDFEEDNRYRFDDLCYIATYHMKKIREIME